MTSAKSLLKALCVQLSRLRTDQSGNIATMFGILVIPMITLIGSAVDYSNAYRTKLRVQEALDATSLAVNRSIGEMSTADLNQLANEMFANNLSLKHTATLASVDIQGDEHIVTLTADGEVDTFFMSLFGIDKMNFSAMSQTKIGTQRFEIAMVLDNSGSMAGSKISDLRTAADDLVEVFFKGASFSDAVKVGIVPFAASVNVGPGYRNASWMDSTGISPVHSENFDENVSRFDIFDNIANADWAGCVEMRPYPLDVQDTSPTPSNSASYFVPMFAPDEPDDEYAAENNYLCDSPSSGGGGRRGRRRSSCSSSGMTWDEAQMNVDKYYAGVRASGDYGPNHNCTTTPITRMTSTKSDITAALNQMDANGMTNIQSGVIWGWRILSNAEPFTEGVPSDDRDWIKAVVLMTDGANTHRGINSPNKSMYSAFGYARNGRLGSPTSSTSTLVSRMNDRTQEACTNVKADGILIYTVAFGISDSVTRNLLRNCATEPDMAFTPENGSELVAVFNQIGVDLSTLRIAQ